MHVCVYVCVCLSVRPSVRRSVCLHAGYLRIVRYVSYVCCVRYVRNKQSVRIHVCTYVTHVCLSVCMPYMSNLTLSENRGISPSNPRCLMIFPRKNG